MGKPASASKTVWVNVLTLIVSLLAVIAGSDLIANQEVALAIIIGVQSVVNIVLRLITKDPIDKGLIVAVFNAVGAVFKRKR